MQTTSALPAIEIFRPGTFVSMQGDELSFSAEDLAEIASSYDPDVNPAPLVVGHPRLDAPAYGWTRGLSVNDAGVLVADPDQVEPAFAEMVRDGRFKRVSAELYPREHPGNPTPGRLHLKHIGFLGAAAPAVKGLKPVSFSALQAGCITFEHPMKEKNMASPDKDKTEDVASFAEREAALAAREAKLAEGEAKLGKDREAASLAATAARHAAHLSFAEAQCATGRVLPAGRDALVFVMDALGDAPATLSFGEGDAARSPVAVLQDLIAAGAPLVSFGEAAPADKGAPDEKRDAVDIGFEARSFAEAQARKGITISAADAVRQVKKGDK